MTPLWLAQGHCEQSLPCVASALPKAQVSVTFEETHPLPSMTLMISRASLARFMDVTSPQVVLL